MRVLIVKLAAIGDVVMALPMINAARSLAPDVHVTWVCGKIVAPLLERVAGIDRLIVLDERRLLRGGRVEKSLEVIRLWRALGRERFDLAALGHADPLYRLLLWSIRTPIIRSLSRTGRPNPLPARHYSFEYVRLITGRDGPDAEIFPMPLFQAPEAPRLAAEKRRLGSGPLVVIAPGGARNTKSEQHWKRWHPEGYASVARQLIDAGCRVALVGADTDSYVLPFFDGLPIVNLIGATSLPEMVGVLQMADLVLSHDTSAIHLPRLAGRPILALFGPTIPEQFLYPAPNARYIWGGAGLPCRPCYDGLNFYECPDNRCMSSIIPDEVARVALDMLQHLMLPNIGKPETVLR